MVLAEWEAYLSWRDRIEEALDPRLYPIAWLDAQVWAGLATVWASDKGCLLTELKRYPTGVFEVHGLVAAGDADEIAGPLLDDVEAYACEIGALFTGCASHIGWGKFLKPRGYVRYQVEYRKEMGHGAFGRHDQQKL